MEITPNVYWLDGGASNLYLCEDADGLTLVDTGTRQRENMVFETIKSLGRQVSSLVRILITHADADHAGSARQIQERSGAVVYASSSSAILLRSGSSPEHMPRLIQPLLRRFFRYEPVPATAITICQDGEILPVLGGLQVIATPGHSADHFAYYSPATGVLFAGDALTTRGARLGVLPQFMTADADEASQSAIRLLGLAPAVIACGHGRPMGSHSSDDLVKLLNELRRA
jgi:glyoxylase-like metal-dependent hydrolase (beta-lactamase superfamily II)